MDFAMRGEGMSKSSEKRPLVEVSEEGLDALRSEFTDAVSHEDDTEKLQALELLIAKCGVPLLDDEVSPNLTYDYEAFLTSLHRMYELTKVRVRLESVLHQNLNH